MPGLCQEPNAITPLFNSVDTNGEAAWGYLQSGISNLHSSQYYLDYGAKHLDRFRAVAQKTNVI